MKKIALVLFVAFCATDVYSQDESIVRTNSNEIGIDASPFVFQFLSFNDNQSYGFDPYYVMYRRHINKWAIRAGIGGRLQSSDETTNDTIAIERGRSHIDFRLGAERKVDFAKRWQCYYGVDLWMSQRSITSIETNKNSNAKVEHLNEYQRFGLAPLLGFRFKINERISVTTETNFQVFLEETEDSREYSDQPDFNDLTTSSGIETQFNPPTSVFFTFNF